MSSRHADRRAQAATVRSDERHADTPRPHGRRESVATWLMPADGGCRVVTRGRAERANAGSDAGRVQRKRERLAADRWLAQRGRVPAQRRGSTTRPTARKFPPTKRRVAWRQWAPKRAGICSTAFLLSRPLVSSRAASCRCGSTRASASLLPPHPLPSGLAHNDLRAQATRRASL